MHISQASKDVLTQLRDQLYGLLPPDSLPKNFQKGNELNSSQFSSDKDIAVVQRFYNLSCIVLNKIIPAAEQNNNPLTVVAGIGWALGISLVREILSTLDLNPIEGKLSYYATCMLFQTLQFFQRPASGNLEGKDKQDFFKLSEVTEKLQLIGAKINEGVCKNQEKMSPEITALFTEHDALWNRLNELNKKVKDRTISISIKALDEIEKEQAAVKTAFDAWCQKVKLLPTQTLLREFNKGFDVIVLEKAEEEFNDILKSIAQFANSHRLRTDKLNQENEKYCEQQYRSIDQALYRIQNFLAPQVFSSYDHVFHQELQVNLTKVLELKTTNLKQDVFKNFPHPGVDPEHIEKTINLYQKNLLDACDKFEIELREKLSAQKKLFEELLTDDLNEILSENKNTIEITIKELESLFRGVKENTDLETAYQTKVKNAQDLLANLTIEHLRSKKFFEHLFSKKGCDFYLKLSFPNENLKSYKNSYILVGKKVRYITFSGEYETENVRINDIEKFLLNVSAMSPKNDSKLELRPELEFHPKERRLYLSYKQVNDLITLNGGHKPGELEDQKVDFNLVSPWVTDFFATSTGKSFSDQIKALTQPLIQTIENQRIELNATDTKEIEQLGKEIPLLGAKIKICEQAIRDIQALEENQKTELVKFLQSIPPNPGIFATVAEVSEFGRRLDFSFASADNSWDSLIKETDRLLNEVHQKLTTLSEKPPSDETSSESSSPRRPPPPTSPSRVPTKKTLEMLLKHAKTVEDFEKISKVLNTTPGIEAMVVQSLEQVVTELKQTQDTQQKDNLLGAAKNLVSAATEALSSTPEKPPALPELPSGAMKNQLTNFASLLEHLKSGITHDREGAQARINAFKEAFRTSFEAEYAKLYGDISPEKRPASPQAYLDSLTKEVTLKQMKLDLARLKTRLNANNEILKRIKQGTESILVPSVGFQQAETNVQSLTTEQWTNHYDYQRKKLAWVNRKLKAYNKVFISTKKALEQLQKEKQELDSQIEKFAQGSQQSIEVNALSSMNKGIETQIATLSTEYGNVETGFTQKTGDLKKSQQVLSNENQQIAELKATLAEIGAIIGQANLKTRQVKARSYGELKNYEERSTQAYILKENRFYADLQQAIGNFQTQLDALKLKKIQKTAPLSGLEIAFNQAIDEKVPAAQTAITALQTVYQDKKREWDVVKQPPALPKHSSHAPNAQNLSGPISPGNEKRSGFSNKVPKSKKRWSTSWTIFMGFLTPSLAALTGFILEIVLPLGFLGPGGVLATAIAGTFLAALTPVGAYVLGMLLFTLLVAGVTFCIHNRGRIAEKLGELFNTPLSTSEDTPPSQNIELVEVKNNQEEQVIREGQGSSPVGSPAPASQQPTDAAVEADDKGTGVGFKPQE